MSRAGNEIVKQVILPSLCCEKWRANVIYMWRVAYNHQTTAGSKNNLYIVKAVTWPGVACDVSCHPASKRSDLFLYRCNVNFISLSWVLLLGFCIHDVVPVPRCWEEFPGRSIFSGFFLPLQLHTRKSFPSWLPSAASSWPYPLS